MILAIIVGVIGSIVSFVGCSKGKNTVVQKGIICIMAAFLILMVGNAINIAVLKCTEPKTTNKTAIEIEDIDFNEKIVKCVGTDGGYELSYENIHDSDESYYVEKEYVFEKIYKFPFYNLEKKHIDVYCNLV